MAVPKRMQRMEVTHCEYDREKQRGRAKFRCKKGHEHWWIASYKLGRKKIFMSELQFYMLVPRWLQGGADGVCPKCEKELAIVA